MTIVYGVNPSGVAIKSAAVIKAEIEAKVIALFGSNAVQTAQTPFGHLNAMIADLAAVNWENLQNSYNSFDVDVAGGARLDSLGKLRMIYRMDGETDIAFRKAITNAGTGRIDTQDIERAAANVTGVSWAHVWVNEGDFFDANGMAPGSISLAALGGDDEAVAAALNSYAAPGVIQHGNTSVAITLDGYCRTVTIMRPTEVDANVSITVNRFNDADGCPPPAPSTIASGLLASLNANRPANGVGVTEFDLTALLGELYGRRVQLVAATSLPDTPSFEQILNLTAINVTANT